MLRAGILMSMGDFPGRFESRNLSRDNLGMEIGHTHAGAGR